MSSGIYEKSPGAVIQLKIPAACSVQIVDERGIGSDEICFKGFGAFIELMDIFLCKRHIELLQKLCRSGNGKLCNRILILLCLYKTEVIEEGMGSLVGDLSGEEGVINHGSLSLKGKTCLGRLVVNARKAPHKIQMPGCAAELTVCEHVVAGFFLLRNEVQNAAVLDDLQLLFRDRAGFAAPAGILEPGGAKKAPDEIIAERGRDVFTHVFYVLL